MRFSSTVAALLSATTSLSTVTAFTLFGDDLNALDESNFKYENCGLPSDVLQIKSIDVEPSFVKPGANVTITATAEVLERIEDGAYVDVTVRLGRIKLLQKQFDLCEDLVSNVDMECPVEKGLYKIVKEIELPSQIPRARFNVDVNGYTVEDDDMACLRVNVDFMHTSSTSADL